MKKRPFLTFIAIVSMLIAAVVIFIQSVQFAGLVKKLLGKYVPPASGVELDFSELAVKMFPPGISIRNPRFSVTKAGLLPLPPGTVGSAERVDLTFLPFQMLSGDIRIHRVTVVKGDVSVKITHGWHTPKPELGRTGFHWDELLQVHAEAIALDHTRVRFESVDPPTRLDFVAESLSLGQWLGKGGIGYEVDLAVQDLEGSMPKVLKNSFKLAHMQAAAHINALGMRVDTLEIDDPGLSTEVSGQIRGDLLKGKGLAFESDVNIRGDLSRWLTLIRAPSETPLPTGTVAFKGKVRGNLDHPLDTLRFEGAVNGEKLAYGLWQSDHLLAEGAWQADATGGEIAVSKVSIWSEKKERTAPMQIGLGGRIDVGAFKLRLGSREAISIPLTLEHAHLHWLAGTMTRYVYPLTFRVSGPARLEVSLPQTAAPWKLHADLNLKLEGFQLDNQKLGTAKTLHRVLDVAKLEVNGGVTVDPTGMYPSELSIVSDRSKLQVSGKVDFNHGFDLQGGGHIDLKDLGQVAENEIRGEGSVSVHVHGPSSRTLVDFDTDLADAYYLRMNLGDFKGRVTWDDDPSKIIFTAVNLRQNLTYYTGNGVIDLGNPEDTIALDIDLDRGNSKDFFHIFDELTEPLWWFPTALNGDLTGKIKVRGGVKLDQLEVLADLSSPGLDYYGETLRNVSVRGGYDKGKYSIESLKALKHLGKVSASISFDAAKRFDWQFKTEDLIISDFDHLARLDVPIRGKVSISSRGHGIQSQLECTTQASITEVAVRGVSMPPSQLTIKSAGGVAELQASALGGQGLLGFHYDFNPGTTSSIKAELKHLDFSPILLLLNPRSIQDHGLAGLVSGRIDLAFPSSTPEKASGKFEVSEYLLAKTGTLFQLAHPVAVKIQSGTFDIEDLILKGNQGDAKLTLKARSGNLEGTITGNLDTSIVEFLTPTIFQSVGSAELDLAVSGTLREPTVFGKASLGGAGLAISALDTPFENISGTIQLRQSTLMIERLEGDLAGGRVNGGGTIQFFSNRYPKIDLHGALAGSKLKVFPFQFVKARGKVSVHGQELPYMVDGNIILDSGLSQVKVLSGGQGRLLKSAKYTPPPSSRDESDYPRFKLNIDVLAEQGLQVQNDLFNCELKAHVNLVNTFEAPRLTGVVQVIQGKMTFKDRDFQIQSAAMNFDNPTVINPSFNLTATTEVSGTKVQLYASGRIDAPKIELTSNPVMPEPEIIQLLALGMSADEVRKLKAGDRSLIEQGEAASLVLHSLDFNRDVQNKTGFEIQLDETVNNQAGSSIFKPNAATDTTAAPRIVIKRRIGKQVDVSVRSTLGVGTSNQKEVNAEYHVTPGFSINGVLDISDSQDTQSANSYGVDFQLQKRFK